MSKKNEQKPETTSSSSSWNFDDSSLPSWFSYFQNPGTILLFSSIPFCIGGYVGYRMPSKKLEELAGVKDAEPTTTFDKRKLGVKYAARALRLATFSTVGSVGILGAGTRFF